LIEFFAVLPLDSVAHHLLTTAEIFARGLDESEAKMVSAPNFRG
jgi:hypothetical protein